MSLCITGDEYGIVILSTVRSQPLSEIRNEDQVQPDRSWLLENLGFLTDPHEMNVGITRSKYGLIIIGECSFSEVHCYTLCSLQGTRHY